MKKLFQLLAALCLAAMPLTGCEKEPGEGGGDGNDGNDGNPTITVVSTASDSIVYSVKTNGYNGKYFLSYLESYLVNPDDEDHIAESLEEWIKFYIEMFDDEMMKPFFVESLYEGDQLNEVIDGLAPSTEYTLFCVGVDTETLELTTEISSCEFATSVYEGADDLTFDVSVEGYKITVVPSDNDMTYAYVLEVARFLTNDGIEDEGNDGMFIDDLLKFYGADYTPTTYKGLWTIDANSEVNASGRPEDTVYWLVVFGYDKETGWTNGIYKDLNLTFEPVDTNVTTNLTGDVTVTLDGMMPMSSAFEEYGYWHRNFDFYAYDENNVEHHLLVDLYASDEYAPYEGKYPILFSTMDMEGYARAGYYNEDNEKAGVWYYNENGDIAAAATGEDYFVEVTLVETMTYKVHAVFKDENGHTVDFTWTGYIF